MGGGACCTLTPGVWLPGLFPSSISATVHTVCIRGAGRERLENVNELCVCGYVQNPLQSIFSPLHSPQPTDA